ncbi:monoacylglycerol lipase ABHD12-like [Centruroides sculpturatus]|uniref:monoacylglycerol lipase ABHD12-like n=1 Tax=Centruroides sculpturatus TaxID=218467 RepID=UPI000C6DED85|nr:monoacylglycerol lipase ABHD12-like [Centruroides sculpturatus]XP_023234981.1 monoacylglycerol lipase ABHD12-like [Centruroides sculpturatus]XP_023234982.1 monoacylglycerol lipase ABHD12-like [Centruroides sculpturatus]
MLRQRIHSKEQSDNEQIGNEAQDVQEPKKKWYLILLKVLCGLFFTVYIVIPTIYYCCPTVRRHTIFLNYVSLPLPHNLSEPQKFGLRCSRNFYVESENKIKMGVWHVPSKSALKFCKGGEMEAGKEFADGRPIFLYLHGNSGTRGANHRVLLYKLLTDTVDVHIVTFDYRGFADSTNYPPSVKGLEHDSAVMFNWVKQHQKNSQIYIWGHSLGTAVAVRLASRLCKSEDKPAAVVLEAPFTSTKDAAMYYPLTLFHRYMPFFDKLFLDPMMDEETGFDSEKQIIDITTPLLILHAEDDNLIPFELGERLHQKALKGRPKNLPPPIFITYDYDFDYGHKHIHRDPNLPGIVREFLEGKLQSKFIKKTS